MIACFERILYLKSIGEPCVLVTVIEKIGDGPCSVGAKMVVEKDRKITGTVGGGKVEYSAIDKALEVLSSSVPVTVTYDLMPNSDNQIANSENSNNTVKTGMLCGGTATMFFEPLAVNTTTYIFGAGHIGQSLCKHLHLLDFTINVIDNRQDYLDQITLPVNKILINYSEPFKDFKIKDGSFVIIATPSHAYDYESLSSIYKQSFKPSYIGVISSRKKVANFYERLNLEFDSTPDFSNLYMPAGLSTGGNTPHEIAISLISEILSIKHNKTGHKHMR